MKNLNTRIDNLEKKIQKRFQEKAPKEVYEELEWEYPNCEFIIGVTGPEENRKYGVVVLPNELTPEGWHKRYASTNCIS
jgi:restriction endonuclease S subunit